MEIKPNTLTDIAAKQRAKLKDLLDERAVARYSFSYKRLAKLLTSLGHPDPNAALETCILGFNREDTDSVVEGLNDHIQAAFLASDLASSDKGSITLVETDPFGRPKDYIYMQSRSSSFSSNRALELLVTTFKLKAEQVKAVFDAATSKRSYCTLQCRDHKEEKDA